LASIAASGVRAMPNMSNKLMIDIFSVHRRDEVIAAPDAINSEEGAGQGAARNRADFISP